MVRTWLLRLHVVHVRGLLDGGADTRVGGASAEVAGHCVIDVAVCGMWRPVQQRCRRHDLSGLTVAALDHIDREPGCLHFSPGRSIANTFYRRYCGGTDSGYRRRA